jgi:predicted Ser/Thr protein kinase
MITPSTLRQDLKCGKGAISKEKKCHKGPATTVAVGAAAVGVAAGVGALVLASKRRSRARTAASTPGQGMEVLAEGTRGKVWLSSDKKTVTKVAKDNKAAKDLFQEGKIQSKAYKAGVSTPKVISADAKRKTITMENLEGYKPVRTAAQNATTPQKEAYARSLVSNLSKAHAADIAHGDLNTNVLARDGKLSIIDWGQASPVRYKGMTDILNAIRIADDLSPALAKSMKQEFKPLQAKFTKRERLTVSDFNAFYSRVLKERSRSDAASRPSTSGRKQCGPTSKQCGNSCIPRNLNCRIEGKGKSTSKAKSSPLAKVGRALGTVANYAGPDIAATLIVSGGSALLRRGLKTRRRYGRPRGSKTDFRRSIRDSTYANGFNVDVAQLAL